MTTINRIISSSNRRAKEEERQALINSQGGPKELPPNYVLQNVNFNETTRVAKIEILQSQKYRTIDRYVTQNYVKYPIYSDWKVKTKLYKKSLKLTNQELEYLNVNDDTLICDFAKEIILALNNEDLIPSWFIEEMLEEEYKEILKNLDSDLAEFCHDYNSKISAIKVQINEKETQLLPHQKKYNSKNKKFQRILKKINNITQAKKSAIKSLLTLFIYNYLISETRKNRLNKQASKLRASMNNIMSLISTQQKYINKLYAQIEELNEQIKAKEQEIIERKDHENIIYKQKLLEIEPLDDSVPTNDSFIALKDLSGYEYEKIIGCYVIRNREKDKYYVGQSKDIIKRLKQHFKGTIPNNIIFAEDYYSTADERRENLFEVKIIPCETKDELDQTERRLIEEYDAFNSGYNGTAGNT